MSGHLPRYLPGTALGNAVDAYDAARCELHKRWHQSSDGGMSDANKDSIAPMIMEAIAAYDRSVNPESDLRGGVLS